MEIHNDNMSKQIVKIFSEEQLGSTKNIAESFESEIKNIENYLNLLALDKDIREGDSETCNKKLEEALNHFKGELNNIGRVNKEGIFHCDALQSLEGVNGINYDYLKELFEDPEHKPTLSRGINFKYNDGSQEELLALHIPIYDSDGNFDGTVGAAVYLDEIGENFLSDIEILKDGYIVLIDDNGDVLYHPTQEHITNFWTNASPDRDPKLGEIVKDGIAGNSGIKNYYFNEEKIATYSPANIFEDRTWMVFANFPVESAKESLISSSLKGLLTKILIYYSLILIFVFLLLIILMEKRIFKPITKLSSSVNKITKGQFNIQLEKSKIKEVQDLTDSLSRILASLKLAIMKTGVSKEHLGIGEEKAIKAKEEAETKYKTLYKSSKDAIMILEPPKWNFTAGNPATVKMFGTKNETEFISNGPGKLSPLKQPDGKLSSNKAKEMIDIAMKKGLHSFYWTHKRIDGDVFPAHVLLTRFKLEGRNVLQATVRKISKENQILYKPNSTIKKSPSSKFKKEKVPTEEELKEVLGKKR